MEFLLKNKVDNFQWVLVAVYGAAQPKYKKIFLNKLVHAYSKEKIPLMLGGDFNIIRNPSAKTMRDIMIVVFSF